MELENNLKPLNSEAHYRRIQGLVGEKSFSLVLPKIYAINLGIRKRRFR